MTNGGRTGQPVVHSVLARPDRHFLHPERGDATGRGQRAHQPGAAKPAPARNAAWYPPLSATSALSPEPSKLSVREAARLARTARPSAPPIMNAVLTIPEASPASVGATSPIAASSSGLKVMPPPSP